MGAIKNWTAKQPLVVIALAMFVGWAVGLMAFGWWLWPVQWVDGAPADLALAFRREYVAMTAESFALTGNLEAAQRRVGYFGADAAAVVQDALESAAETDFDRVAVLQAVMLATGALPETSGGEATPAASGGLLGAITRLALPVCGGLLGVGLLGGGLWYFVRRRASAAPKARTHSAAAPTRPVSQAVAISAATPKTDFAAKPGEPPIQQFMTTYVLGDDLYDDSFSIDSPSGDFLGECGVGISESIGVGDPKKVAALEVWLFDKNDIRTVTKVLMSDHLFRDDSAKSRLAAKGEPIWARAGEVAAMETATLNVTARVVDLSYGGGALPPNSYFERITIELACWQRKAPAS